MNATGDAVFDDTLKTALAVSFRQSPFLNVLSEQKATAILVQMKRPTTTPLTREVAAEVCQRASGKVYVSGAISSLGGQYILELNAVNCQTGDAVAKEQATATSKGKVLDVLGTATSRLRSELGKSLASVQKFDVPLEHATTSSLEALKAYSMGRKARGEKGAIDALIYYQRAIELDSSFALAYAAAGGGYADLGETARAAEYFSKAFQLRDHASEREKLSISADYYSNVTGQVTEAAQIYQEKIHSYPAEAAGYTGLGLAYSAMGQYDKAAEVMRQALRLTPERLSPYANLANIALGRQLFDETLAIIQDAQGRNLDDGILHLALYTLAFVSTDPAAIAAQEQWFASRPEYENYGLALASDTAGYAGHLRKSRDLCRRAADSANRADNKEAAALYLANNAVLEAALRNKAYVRQEVSQALKLAGASPGPEFEGALAFAMIGDKTQADKLARDLASRFPLDTQIQSLSLPAIQAQLALGEQNAALAIARLEPASAIEFANIGYANNLSCLYHTYLRGEAYMVVRQGYKRLPNSRRSPTTAASSRISGPERWPA